MSRPSAAARELLTSRCPRAVIAGTGSGVGKTSLALGVARALARRGLRVQTFKVGPDFLDPTYLALASGRTCYNLDGWMTGRSYVRHLFARATADADIAIIEGVMGMFDGASPSSLEGSTAEIALWLDAPVLLVAAVHGVARSLAAVVKGYAGLEPSVRLAGVIANQAGSGKHRSGLRESLASAGLAPLLGAVPRGALAPLQSRHLGLVTASRQVLPQETIDQLADACEKHLDLAEVLRLAASGPAVEGEEEPAMTPLRAAAPTAARIGLARDEAFHFYYPDNLDILRRCGAELIEFSPLRDSRLPPGIQGLYLGGGYPEVHAESLSANGSLLEEVRQFAAAGRCIYAECGGLMYLARAVTNLQQRRVPLAGVLPVETVMLDRLQSLGYVEVTPAAESPWCDGTDAQRPRLRGHEFHYSRVAADFSAAAGWRGAYTARRPGSGAEEAEGFCKGSIIASYVHLHFASCPRAARRLVEHCGGSG
jgi:cobyrinic acid a,c-diamide synthase